MTPSTKDVALPEGEAKRQQVREMFDEIAPRYDLMNKVMTFGLDRHWRSRAIELLSLTEPAVVLDLACGTGDIARSLEVKGHRAVALDLSAGMLAHARPGGAFLLRGDGAFLPIKSASLDAVVSGFSLRNFSDLGAVLGELARVLRPGGALSLLDVSEPSSLLMRAGHKLWFNRAVPLLGGLVGQKSAYSYLPASVAYLPPRRELVAMIDAAGFEEVTAHPLTGGVVQVTTGRRR